jgi:hypothetical protein
MTTYTNPLKMAEIKMSSNPNESNWVSSPFRIITPAKARIKNSHCSGFILSFKKYTAKIAAKIGAKYRKQTAVPMGMYLVDIKKSVMEITPTNPLKMSNFLLFPKIEILFLKRNPKVKNKELTERKKTI